VLPDAPPDYKSLPHWLSELTDSKLKKLLEQGDSQRVRELSLALITVLNEVKRGLSVEMIHRLIIREAFLYLRTYLLPV